MNESKFNELFETDFVSPYKFCKIVNAVLNKNLPPQMFYQYVSKKFIPSSLNSTGKLQISREDGKVWLAHYIERNTKKAEVQNV